MKFLIVSVIFLIFGVSSKPPFTVPYVGLKHIGTISSTNDEGINYEKKIFISNFMTSKPIYARSVCKSFGANMDIASFENRGELQKVQAKLSLEMNQNQPENTRNYGIIIGGMAHLLNERKHFFWVTTGLKVDQPVQNDQSENCMGLKKNAGNLIFTTIPCDKEFIFVCQHLEFLYDN